MYTNSNSPGTDTPQPRVGNLACPSFQKHIGLPRAPAPDSKFQCPVLGKEVRWEEQNVYNPATVVRDGKVYLLYRADDDAKNITAIDTGETRC